MEMRKHERLELSLPIAVSFADSFSYLNLYTKNISAGGVYIETPSSLPQSTTLLMEIQVTPKGNNQYNKRTFVKVKGRVLRSDDKGMAIQFLEEQHFFRA